MSKSNQNATSGEISAIRNILMGEHINASSARFKEMNDKITDVEQRLHQQMEQLADQQAKALQQLRKEVGEKLQELEDTLQQKSSTLHTKIEDTSKSDLTKISTLLQELSQKLVQPEEILK